MRKFDHGARRKLELLATGSLQRSHIKAQRDGLIEQMQARTWMKRVVNQGASAAARRLSNSSGVGRIISLAVMLWPVERMLFRHLKPLLYRGFPLLCAGMGGYLAWRWLAPAGKFKYRAASGEQAK
jgi:hypothetical protein